MYIDKPKKVLWFTNTPSLAAEFLNVPTIGGGWMKALEEKIKDSEQINLAVAFKHGTGELQKFSKDGTVYYAIPDNTSKIKGLINRHLNKLGDEALVSYCLQVVNDFKPDVINIFGTEDAFGLIIDKIKVPVVVHLQGILTVYELKWFAAGIQKLDLIKNSSIKSLIRAESLLHNYYYFKKAAEREQQIFKKGSYFMGRTDWDRRITNVLAPQATYFTSDEMLRNEFFNNTWNKPAGKTKIFISTIQANIYKGLETILEAAFLLRKINKFNFQWLIVGIPASHLLVRIFEKKSGKKFEDCNVVFVGRLEANELVQKELQADIFIHPSHIDNSANSICEAMLLGMPVIATASGGTGSLLIDKKEGLLIQDGDPYAMAGSIIELVQDAKYAAELGKNARKRAMQRHNSDDIVNNLLSIYTEVINSSALTAKAAQQC